VPLAAEEAARLRRTGREETNDTAVLGPRECGEAGVVPVRIKGGNTMKRRWLALALAAMATLLLFVTGAGAIGASKFESADGNLVVNTAGNQDWSGTGTGAPPHQSVGVDLPTGTTDNSFGGGSKEDETAVTVGLGSIPNSKADLARFAVAGEQINGDSYLYLAWSRENQSGTVNFDFEINKVAQPDLTTAGQKNLNRTVNDLLINYAFAGGSNTPTLTLRQWTGSAWGAEANLTANGCADGLTNAGTVSENLGGNPAVDRPAQQFGEAGINLTCAGVVPKNACLPFADAYVKSRSSTSFTSEIKDFIAPVSLNLNVCGTIKIIKHTDPRGLNQDFSYTATNGLSSPFTLNDNGNTTGDSTGNTKAYTDVHEGTYVFTEGADPTGFAFDSVSCTGGGANTTTSGRVATVVLDAGENVVCTYVNKQQLGAIKITKRSIKSATSTLSGAVFTIGSGVGDKTTGADGTVCVDGLAFGTYTVVEKTAPAGYAIDDTTTHNVVVDNSAKCSDATFVGEALSFNDTPLTDILAKAQSQAAGGTASRVTCKDSANANVGNSPQPGASTFADPAQVSATGLRPGTYVCTIIIDP